MRAFEIASYLEDFAPVVLQESWDNSGFCLGDENQEITSVLLGLDCTPELIEEAISVGANMIITHHPLIFKGLKKISNSTVQERMLIKLIKSDIVVYAAHTNLDKVIDGVSGLIADKLSLVNREILQEEGSDGTGLGIIAEFMEDKTFQEVVGIVKKEFNIVNIKCSTPLKGSIRKVAVCGGSGSSLIGSAMAKGAQLFISGDISYHNFFCEKGFMLMDIGHYESEIGVLDVIASILRKKIPTFVVRKTEKNNNPIHYY